MPWMIVLFNVLMALATNGANEGMNGSDLEAVRDIWRSRQPTAVSTVKPGKVTVTRAKVTRK